MPELINVEVCSEQAEPYEPRIRRYVDVEELAAKDGVLRITLDNGRGVYNIPLRHIFWWSEH